MEVLKRLKNMAIKYKDPLMLLCGLGLYCAIALALNLQCPIRALTGVSCPGCGMTRAVVSLLQLDFKGAFYYHPMVFGIVPVAAVLFLLNQRKNKRLRKLFILAVCLLFVTVYLYRFTVMKSPVLKFDPKNGALYRFYALVFGWFC